jgi:drug/metabolite transporter (DMT)-like permease
LNTQALKSDVLLLLTAIIWGFAFVAQRNAHPAHAAIILSLEAVFAAVGGWFILDEILTPRGLFGCLLMLSGMLLSQLWGILNSFAFNNSRAFLIRK